MFHVIPSNQLSLLVEPLSLLLSMPKQHPLATDWILVPHRGMQHWLSMALAEKPERQICMNIDMLLPVSGFWQLVHRILGDAGQGDSAHWRREYLVWQLFRLLARSDVVDDPQMQEPTAYWRSGSVGQQALKRFQLSEQLADLFEQYLIYRPDWIAQWKTETPEHWQALLWQHLVHQAGDHPLELINDAVAHAASPKQPLPERLFLFSVNNIAPIWLDFLKALSDRNGMDIHVLYLNPSDEYWQDHVSERREAQLRAQWFEKGIAETVLDTGNPLLSSLGTQGQAFIKLLSDRAELETSCFSEPHFEQGTPTCLQRLQQDVLHLHDGTQEPTALVDDSITLASAHSALREVQGLHDWLLARFDEQPDLKPRDVLVMCPNIEHYAPFVEAVFARGYDQLSEQTPPLPCSIADRSLITADPLVHAFLSFLDLPDDRLQVSQIIAWLHVPAIQTYFGFSRESLDKITEWLHVANIHWGLDAEHKAQLLKTETATDTYSWRLGLERLLLGFAWGDDTTLIGDRLMLPPVEGDDAVILGRLIEFMDRLAQLSQQLRAERTVSDWVQLLRTDVLQAFFGSEADSRVFQVIDQCLQDWIVRVAGTGDDCVLSGAIVRYYLQQELGRPETTSNQYLMGQITFCSMIPMRSVPFKVIGVLGLNDGEFPRQRQGLGFDLMATQPMRLGDRSRRGDDRYLFLETLLSAQEKLYLSFQGNNIHNNTDQQPSLVLAELMDYLTRAFQWRFPHLITKIPMQPFSPTAYQGDKASFDAVWLRLAKPTEAVETVLLPEPTEDQLTVSLQGLVSFFDNPTEFWAKHQLGVYLDNNTVILEDTEPFETNNLLRYQVQTELLAALRESGGDTASLDPICERTMASGSLPEHPMAALDLQQWQSQAVAFDTLLQQHLSPTVSELSVSIELSGVTLVGTVPLTESGHVHCWRLADPKPKDYLKQWFNLLAVQVTLGANEVQSEGWYRGPKGFQHVHIKPHADATEMLASWLAIYREGLQKPVLFNADVGLAMNAKGAKKSQSELWLGSDYAPGLIQDPYMALFWKTMPERDDFDRCSDLYATLTAQSAVSAVEAS